MLRTMTIFCLLLLISLIDSFSQIISVTDNEDLKPLNNADVMNGSGKFEVPPPKSIILICMLQIKMGIHGRGDGLLSTLLYHIM